MAELTLHRHPTDTTSLVFGIVFVGLAAVWLLVQLELLALPDVAVALPIVLVAAGVVGLVTSIGRVRRSSGDR